jgi:hypothetical protein
LCRRCKNRGQIVQAATSRLTAGDPAKFWSGALQSLSDSCYSVKTRDEVHERKTGKIQAGVNAQLKDSFGR